MQRNKKNKQEDERRNENDDENNNNNNKKIFIDDEDNFLIQSTFNEIRIKLYAMLIFYKKLILYYNNINNLYQKYGIESIPIIEKCIFNRVPLYMLKNYKLLNRLLLNIGSFPPNTIIILAESYYKILVIKMIIEKLINYRNDLRYYIKYLYTKIAYVIETQNSFRQVYDYILNINYNNGMNYNCQYQKLIDNYVHNNNIDFEERDEEINNYYHYSLTN